MDINFYLQQIIDLKRELKKKDKKILDLEANERHQRRLKDDIREILTNFDERISFIGLKLDSVKIRKIENNDNLIFKLGILEKIKIDINKVLFFKDKHFISDFVYNAFVTEFDLPLPSLHYIKILRKSLNSKFDLNVNVRNSRFVNIKSRIAGQLNAFLSNLEEEFDDNIPLRIKLSADGTNIGRNLKLINYTFTLLNEFQGIK
ncbi:unnamed protein product [Brachionus calyciflorus]|uniref:Uncharacterized protein n=1 Tax=Brachionus calyciflorus TaxID=104777 RepID=A0A814RQC8_9BILA|nr:unnamed protein product [Brachionus calyciflorus]